MSFRIATKDGKGTLSPEFSTIQETLDWLEKFEGKYSEEQSHVLQYELWKDTIISISDFKALNFASYSWKVGEELDNLQKDKIKFFEKSPSGDYSYQEKDLIIHVFNFKNGPLLYIFISDWEDHTQVQKWNKYYDMELTYNSPVATHKEYRYEKTQDMLIIPLLKKLSSIIKGT